MCEQAAFLANALVLSESDAVFDLSRRVSWSCDELQRELFPQCEDRDRLAGYVIGNHRGEFFVDTPADYRGALGFFVEAVDEEYSDELGGPQMQILGISSCGEGPGASYHVVYLVGLGDPESTLLTDWELVLDDPLSEIACGDIRPWVGATANLNPPQSESQPTPIPATGSS
jgi:hypothetical protein